MKLYFLDEFLGDISNINVEGMWINAEIILSKNMWRFNDFFAALVDEDHDFNADNDCEDWLDDSNWSIIDDKDRKKGIYIPAVYSDNEINWRWR